MGLGFAVIKTRVPLGAPRSHVRTYSDGFGLEFRGLGRCRSTSSTYRFWDVRVWL